MFGGKLKDEGGYSCIFSPPLTCKDKPLTISGVSDDLTYGKLMKIKDADKEFKIANIISRIPNITSIPLWKNYFVVSESICSPSIHQTDKDLSTCKVLKDHNMSEFKLTMMPFRGVALDRYKYNNFDFNAFTLHLIEAGALLNIFGIVHKDLHKGNILVDNHDVPRIIDFNLSIDTRSPLQLKPHSHSYHLTQEPPDATIINAISLHKGYKMDNVIKNICKKSIIKDISLLLNISDDDIFNSITKYYESIETSDSEWFLNHWNKIDSWSIGVILVQIIIIINKDISQTMKNMLKKMCAVNPNERIDCVQALRYLDPNNFIIKKYGTKWFQKLGLDFI